MRKTPALNGGVKKKKTKKKQFNDQYNTLKSTLSTWSGKEKKKKFLLTGQSCKVCNTQVM